jgi:hypothetical protein
MYERSEKEDGMRNEDAPSMAELARDNMETRTIELELHPLIAKAYDRAVEIGDDGSPLLAVERAIGAALHDFGVDEDYDGESGYGYIEADSAERIARMRDEVERLVADRLARRTEER